MTEQKIDRVKLSKMLRSGKSQKEAAEFFGVSEAAISKARKELNLNVVKNTAMETAHKVADENLDALAQLRKINTYANELLDLVMRWQRGEDKALRILESQVKMIKVGKGEDVEWVKEYKIKDPRELALKAMAEIRGQLSLQLSIFETMSNIEAVREFQIEVLDAIAEVDKAVRDKIITNLKQKRALRNSIRIN